MDLRTGELESESYDLVSCRALLHQIADYGPQVLAQMAEAVRPGGWLLIQEPDFHLALTTRARGMGTHLEWAYRLGTRERGRLAHRSPSCHAWWRLSAWGIRRPRPTYRTSVAEIVGAKYFQLFFAEVRDRVIACRAARRGNDRRCLGVAGRGELLDPVLDDDSRLAAQAAARRAVRGSAYVVRSDVVAGTGPFGRSVIEDRPGVR